MSHAAAPVELLGATDMPAHSATVGATALVAPAVAMPSAAMLAPAPQDAAQHSEVVGQVLSEALGTGSANAPDVDGLLAAFGGHAPALEHLGDPGGGHFAGAALAAVFAPEMLVVHVDAPAPA
jgi:hypothetical protein